MPAYALDVGASLALTPTGPINPYKLKHEQRAEQARLAGKAHGASAPPKCKPAVDPATVKAVPPSPSKKVIKKA